MRGQAALGAHTTNGPTTDELCCDRLPIVFCRDRLLKAFYRDKESRNMGFPMSRQCRAHDRTCVRGNGFPGLHDTAYRMQPCGLGSTTERLGHATRWLCECDNAHATETLCRDRDFSIAIDLFNSQNRKKKRFFDPRDLGRHSLVSELRHTNT